MRDIYRRLGLLLDAAPDAVAAQASKLPPRNHIRRAAEEILLHPQRREEYYAATKTLRTIGQLRANLGLLEAPLWRELPLQDFDVPASGSVRSQLERLRARQSTPTPPPMPPTAKPASGPSSRHLVLGAAAIAIGILWWGMSRQSETSGSPGTSRPFTAPYAGTGSSATPRPAPEAFPGTGILLNEARGLNEGAPFTVRTAPRGGYYIKVVEIGSDRVFLTAFIRGGDQISTFLPPGSYELRYASGTEWFGFGSLFGEDTVYSKADQIFQLRETPYGYEGVTVELILQRSGNLRTRGISASAF